MARRTRPLEDPEQVSTTIDGTVGRVFLMSPAHCGGIRARQLCHAAARFDLAQRLRAAGGAPLGDVFSFMSGLYFRGKLTYARAFARGPADMLVITPSDGLLRADRCIGLDDLSRFAAVKVDADDLRYRLPLERDGTALARRIGALAEVVLLGSLATTKYLSILEPIFGPRLRVPQEFIGRGDMSRGALLLRAVRAQCELDYIPAAALGAGTRTGTLRP